MGATPSITTFAMKFNLSPAPPPKSLQQRLELCSAPNDVMHMLEVLRGLEHSELSSFAPSVVRRLDDDDWGVRATACSVLSMMDVEDLEEHRAVVAHAATDDPIIGVRWQARKVLSKLEELCGRWSMEHEESRVR